MQNPPTALATRPDVYPATRDLVRALREHTRFARGLDRFKTRYRPYICPFEDLLRLIPAGASVFDIGCGNGAFLLLAGLFRRPAALGGVEIQPRLVENARRLLQDACGEIPVGLQLYDGLILPPALGDYQLLFLIDVLHHVPRPRQLEFLAQIHARMQSGARLVVKDIDAARPVLCACNKLHDWLLTGEIGHELAASDTARALADLGFRTDPVTSRRVACYPHFTVVATKP